MDRRLLGILAATLIVSTAIAVLIFVERVETSIEVLRDSWEIIPSNGIKMIPLTESSTPYTLSLVGRRDMVDLTVRFGVLRNRTVSLEGVSGSMPDVAKQIPDIVEMERNARDLDLARVEHEGEVAFGDDSFDLLLLDYSPYLLSEAPPGDLVSLTTIFGLLFDSRGNLSQYFVGSWDFFENRESVVQELTIQLNDNSTKYANEQLMAPGIRPLDELDPNLGSFSFLDLSKDDRVFYTMTINGAELGGEEAVMHVALIRIDGEFQPPIAHLLSR